MIRREDWPTLLNDFVTDTRNEPFAWGSHDCVTFAMNWVARATNVDPIQDLRGKWDDEATAHATIHEVGGLEHAIDARFQRHAFVLAARRGDIGLVNGGPNEDSPVVAINVGPHWAAPGENGLVMLPLLRNGVPLARAAWMVGD